MIETRDTRYELGVLLEGVKSGYMYSNKAHTSLNSDHRSIEESQLSFVSSFIRHDYNEQEIMRQEKMRQDCNGIVSPFRSPWLLFVLVVLTANHCTRQHSKTDMRMSVVIEEMIMIYDERTCKSPHNSYHPWQ